MKVTPPPIPKVQADTLRQQIVQQLQEGPCSALELSAALGISEKDVRFHLEHIRRSVKGSAKLVITPCRCLGCGFVFSKREKLTAPGKCPRCRHEGISEPVFALHKNLKTHTKEPMPMDNIETFLAAEAFGVVGASSNPEKFGNRVLRCYLRNGRVAIPVNPREKSIEGVDCVASVLELPQKVQAISVITPPAVTEEIVKQAIAKGIKNIWMQPGAESPQAVALCRENGINVIADGSCLLVVLRYPDH